MSLSCSRDKPKHQAPPPAPTYSTWLTSDLSSSFLLNSKRAAELILPIIAKRQAHLAQLEAAGASEQELRAAVKNDGIEWFARMAGRDGRFYKPEHAQISLSVAAIHTTSDLMMQAILDLAAHPDILAELRAEVADVLGREGWKKTALYGLKKLDSCIRETQRLKPIGIGEFIYHPPPLTHTTHTRPLFTRWPSRPGMGKD